MNDSNGSSSGFCQSNVSEVTHCGDELLDGAATDASAGAVATEAMELADVAARSGAEAATAAAADDDAATDAAAGGTEALKLADVAATSGAETHVTPMSPSCIELPSMLNKEGLEIQALRRDR